MRRQDKLRTDSAFLDQVAGGAHYCQLALAGGTEPYIVPMNFGFAGLTFWFHCAAEGTKLELLRRDSRVCISLVAGYETVSAETACGWGAHFRSVIAHGRALIVTSSEEKITGLRAIMRTYSGSDHDDFPQQALDAVVVFKVPVDSWTGKES